MRISPLRSVLILALAGLLGLNACTKPDNSPQDITDIVADDSRFTVLSALIAKAGLGPTLRQGTLTVFAPTDAAFKAAGIDAAVLNSATNAYLTNLLQNHVLGTRTPSASIPAAENTEVTTLGGGNTLGGGKLYVSKKAGVVSVNGARVTQADLEAPNGVVHVVDKVLLPAAGTITQVASSLPDLSMLVVAVNRIAQRYPSVANGLAGPGPLTVFAPTNKAFADAGYSTVAALNGLPEDQLVTLLTYHILPVRAFSPLLTSGDMVTFQGTKVTVGVSGGTVTVRGIRNPTPATVIQPDLVATNAVIHVVDKVLLP